MSCLSQNIVSMTHLDVFCSQGVSNKRCGLHLFFMPGKTVWEAWNTNHNDVFITDWKFWSHYLHLFPDFFACTISVALSPNEPGRSEQLLDCHLTNRWKGTFKYEIFWPRTSEVLLRYTWTDLDNLFPSLDLFHSNLLEKIGSTSVSLLLGRQTKTCTEAKVCWVKHCSSMKSWKMAQNHWFC